MTTATLEPEAVFAPSAHREAVRTNHSFPAHDTTRAPNPANSGSLDSVVDSSEIEVDPATHLPFLKNVRFDDFNVSANLKRSLAAAGFKIPTPVQAKSIPPAIQGADILATASTGTGKTLSFLVPIIEHMDTVPLAPVKGRHAPIRALILLPTRELAMQVLEHYARLVPRAKNDAVLVVGGLSENTQLDQLSRGPRLVVATPGRLEDFLRRRAVSIGAVEMLVLDEVDRMLDMGFLPAIRRIVGAIPRTRQTMCYSATLDANVREIVRDYVRSPVRIEIGRASHPCEQVELRACTVMQDQKLGLLDQMLKEETGSFLVFSRTKHGADRICKKLERLGHDADVIHGDRSQSQRTAALKGFSSGKHRILVATDVAARGIDVHDIAHVVNYDLPNGTDDFVHRVGRTGRAGASGVATTFVMPQERSDARKMERELKVTFLWRNADKNLEKEERNKPLDLSTGASDLLALETRAWRSGDVSAQTQARNIGSSPYKGNRGNGFRSRAGSGGGASAGRSTGRRGGSGRSGSGRAGTGHSGNNHPGGSRSGPARRGQ